MSRLRSFPREVCQEDVGLGVERQAQSLVLECCLGETLLSSGSCPAHSVLGLLAGRGSLSKTPGGTSACGKTCQALPAPSLPFAWCSPLGSVADTEDFFVTLFSFPLSEGQKRRGRRRAAPLPHRKRRLVNGEERARRPQVGHSRGPGPEQAAGHPLPYLLRAECCPRAPCPQSRPPVTLSHRTAAPPAPAGLSTQRRGCVTCLLPTWLL